MKIIISPAKKMNIDTDTLEVSGLPQFIREARKLCEEIQKLSYAEAKALWNCNDKLAELNYQRFVRMDLERCLTPAILSYEGLQYQHMAPGVFTEDAIRYVNKHLRILSGFYGVLSPFDGVVPYRLEMQAKLAVDGKKDLYDFWGRRIYDAVRDEDGLIINLASREYSKTVERFLKPEDFCLTVEFGELVEGRVKQKGTFAKMARGEMVRYMAEHDVQKPEGIKAFRELGYHYSEEYSDFDRYVFLLEQ